MVENTCSCGIKIISPEQLNITVCEECNANETVYAECFNCYHPVPHYDRKCSVCGCTSSVEGFLRRVIA